MHTLLIFKNIIAHQLINIVFAIKMYIGMLDLARC